MLSRQRKGWVFSGRYRYETRKERKEKRCWRRMDFWGDIWEGVKEESEAVWEAGEEIDISILNKEQYL